MLIEYRKGVDKTGQVVVATDLQSDTINPRRLVCRRTKFRDGAKCRVDADVMVCVGIQSIDYRAGLVFDLAEGELRCGASVQFRPTQDGKVFGHFFVHATVERLINMESSISRAS